MSDSKEFISQVTPNIFATILDLEVFEQGDQEMEKGSKYVTASVQINGTWNGVVTLSIPDGLSRECAAIMFDVASDEATEEDIEDAMGELANMTGGSFKSLIDGTCELGLPVVTIGIDYQVKFPGSVLDCATTFKCNEHLMRGSVHVREDE